MATVKDNWHVDGHLSCKTLTLPAAAVANTQVSGTADILATKVRHQFPISWSQKDATDVVSETVLLHIANADGDIHAFEVRPTIVPTGGDKQYTVDIQMAADGSGSWTTLLSAVITVSTSSTANTLIAGTLTDTSYLNGEAVRIVVTASGSTGSQGQGFVATLWLREKPA